MNTNIDHYKPALQVGHYVAIWIFLLGLLLSGLSRGNEIENQQIETETRQKAIIKQQVEIKQEIRDARTQQQEIRDLLIEIKTRQENP